MVGVVIAAHGNLGQELLQTMIFIIGSAEQMKALTVDPSIDVQVIQKNIQKAIKEVDAGDGVLVLTDMFGGTPSNISLSFLEDNKVEVVTGVNLPMLIRLCQCRSGGKGLKEVAEEVVTYGRKSISLASEILAM